MSQQGNNVIEGRLALQITAMPANTNANGDIFGGWLVSHMDMAGAIEARHYAKSRVVTVAIDGLVFIKPVNVGDTVCCYAQLIKIGRTSMCFNIGVWTMAFDCEDLLKVAQGTFTFVAIDEIGKPHAVNRE
jgi:acyl-CoA thioesterase YciA